MLDIILIIIIVILGVFYFCRTTENMDYTNDRFERPDNIMDDNNDNIMNNDTSNADSGFGTYNSSPSVSNLITELYYWLLSYNRSHNYGSSNPYYDNDAKQSTFRRKLRRNRNNDDDDNDSVFSKSKK